MVEYTCHCRPDLDYRCPMHGQLSKGPPDDTTKLTAALREIFELYAGSEGFIPQTCPEGYLLDLTKRMATVAGDALKDAPPDQISTGYWLTHEELEAVKAEARADEVRKVVEWLRKEHVQILRFASPIRNAEGLADKLASGQWKEAR